MANILASLRFQSKPVNAEKNHGSVIMGALMAKPEVRSNQRRRKVALALQGGGSHGAFTWGVLDRMLEDETIEIIGVTGTART